MKIAILSRKDVSGWYAATLMQRGHEVTISGGGALDAFALKPYLDCDGCLLLSDEPDLLEIADYMETSGKKVWRELSGIPAATPSDIKRAEAKRTEKKRAEENEKKRVNCVGIGPAPAGRWWVVLEYDDGNGEVESTQDTYSEAVKRAKELAAEHKVRWVER